MLHKILQQIVRLILPVFKISHRIRNTLRYSYVSLYLLSDILTVLKCFPKLLHSLEHRITKLSELIYNINRCLKTFHGRLVIFTLNYLVSCYTTTTFKDYNINGINFSDNHHNQAKLKIIRHLVSPVDNIDEMLVIIPLIRVLLKYY